MTVSIKYSLFFSCLLLIFSACKKQALFEDPLNSITPAVAFSTPDRIEKESIGMYDGLQNINFLCGRVLIYADQRGIDESPNQYFGNIGYLANIVSSDNTSAAAWQGGYSTIFKANNFLQNFLPVKDTVPVAKANQYIGEAKFIRSLCYFYLVNLWAQPINKTWQNTDTTTLGVPLILNAVQDGAEAFNSSNQLPRATVAQVYAQMESDLLDAANLLPVPPGDPFTRVARANKSSALGLLMRLYLYKGEWQKASNYADSVIAYSTLKLNSSPEITFSSPYTSAESIFSVAMSGGDNPNTNNSLGQHYGATARGDINISAGYVALMDTANDARFKKLIKVDKNGLNWTLKYPGITTDFVPVLRYAEVLLTKAEALARLGDIAGALTYVNKVRLRSNPNLPVSTTSQQATIDAILTERRIELAFEGHGILEFQRTGRDLPAHYGQPVQPWASQRMVLPIPMYDVQKNINLAQNPGY